MVCFCFMNFIVFLNLQELLTLTDRYSFEISTKEEIVHKLDIRYKRLVVTFIITTKFGSITCVYLCRYLEIKKENDELKDSVNKLQILTEKNRNEHGKLCEITFNCFSNSALTIPTCIVLQRRRCTRRTWRWSNSERTWRRRWESSWYVYYIWSDAVAALSCCIHW